jgi:hypothetical protein
MIVRTKRRVQAAIKKGGEGAASLRGFCYAAENRGGAI